MPRNLEWMLRSQENIKSDSLKNKVRNILISSTNKTYVDVGIPVIEIPSYSGIARRRREVDHLVQVARVKDGDCPVTIRNEEMIRVGRTRIRK